MHVRGLGAGVKKRRIRELVRGKRWRFLLYKKQRWKGWIGGYAPHCGGGMM
jgi:hypothetical protein